jgi:signal transduction histidine kinase
VRRGAQDYLVKGRASKHDIQRSIRYAIERKRLEEQVLQAQKMQAVGLLADGIAHEFNNLLQVIMGYTRYALEVLDPQSQTASDLRHVMAASDRATRLTEQLLNFGRPHSRSLIPLSVPQQVEQLAALLRPLLGDAVRLEVQLAPDAEQIVADENLLQQALMNLCINARDAMPEGGTLTISSRPVAIAEGTLEHQQRGIAGDFLLLEVADTGLGIPSEILERIFDPFFTTKSPHGTGLGLAVVYSVMQQLGGTVSVRSEVGKGSCFGLYLHRFPADAVSAAPAPACSGTAELIDWATLV